MNRQLSFTQHGMWIAARMGAATAYHMPIVVALAGTPDRGALAKACRSVVERHPLLGSALRDGDINAGAPGHLIRDFQDAAETYPAAIWPA